MPQSWSHSLSRYHYPVCLKEFRRALSYPAFFNQTISGNRESTISFENYFRENADKIEPWFEVVFWKLYSQPQYAQKRTEELIRQMRMPPEVTPSQLLEKAHAFMSTESRAAFESFRTLFRFRTNVIATVATFPAFLDPERFPMVDTRVAKWINMHYRQCNTVYPDAPPLIPSIYNRTHSSTVLTTADFEFYLRWIQWSRYMAQKLTATTGVHWRARDVEMAIFTAWGDRGSIHPVIKLNFNLKGGEHHD